MKVKLNDLQTIGHSFQTILQKEIPVKVAYRMMKISGKVLAAYKEIGEINDRLVRKYGKPVKDEKGKDTGRVQVPPEKMEVYRKEYEMELGGEVDLGVDLIPYECLEAMGNISPMTLNAIAAFIEDKKPA